MSDQEIVVSIRRVEHDVSDENGKDSLIEYIVEDDGGEFDQASYEGEVDGAVEAEDDAYARIAYYVANGTAAKRGIRTDLRRF